MNAHTAPASLASRANLPTTATPSIRARFLERRTYLRPLDEDGEAFETPVQALDRVMGHQRYLWEQAVGRPLNSREELELDELRGLIEAKKVSMSGRVKWMGGTDIIKERASAAFNCSFTLVETPADLVDVFWLLLQGCGVGFRPKPGLLTGFPTSITKVEVIGSTRTAKGGREDTISSVENGVWTISFGDSAKGWAKGLGKIFAEKPRAHTLVLDYSELRPGGQRLRGYGWLSSGWKPFADGMKIITDVMQARANALLTDIDLGDVVNALGTVLSSRRSAQIWLKQIEATEWTLFDAGIMAFVDAKTDRWEKGKGHREQSNNSLVFMNKPSRQTVVELLKRILDTGEPGFVNGAAARRRAPEMEGLNPCAEILLPSKGFCNLVQVVWHRFNGDYWGLLRAQYLAARANYRQTCVSMRDGVLQLQWNDNQQLLRLCGVSPTGYVAWEGLKDADMHEGARDAAIDGANAMADELGTPRPRRVTQCQPAGTSSKVMGLDGDEVHEGAHVSPSRYIFNHVNFSVFDPMVEKLMLANYDVRPNPADKTGVLVKFPVAYPDSPFYSKVVKEIDGQLEELELVSETGVDQLERYRMLMEHYVQHNCSITVSFDVEDIEPMADWFMQHWDTYVGVSFLKRNDPTRTAEELGFLYLPQECVSRRMYEDYAARLLPVDLADDKSHDMLDVADCATGACPVR
jgi:adenosylcobalamin-dependent ribonucleoside-triphosphate reductase